MIRNPVYCGKIIVPSFKDEPMQIVDAQHQAIITEALFDRARKILENRKRSKTQISMPSRLLLRGFLKCPKCS
ncbi:recombinase family protein [Mucilaginibacter rubeus]|uniref:recombinase family protein n=1 Tax=Mucilaginibacter rubeus TaxID=2027860 RepID=UPI003399F367